MSDSTKESSNLSEEATTETDCGAVEGSELSQTDKGANPEALASGIREPLKISEKASDVEKLINVAKNIIAQLPHLSACALEINVRENYVCLDKLDEQSNANQWARIAVHDKNGKDCTLMLYDQDWGVSFSGAYRACFEKLDAMIAVNTCEPTQKESSNLSEEATTETDCGAVEGSELSQTDKGATPETLASDIREPLKISEKVINAAKEIIAQLPHLSACALEINVRENYVCLDKLDEQSNANQWARIAVHDKDCKDCTLMLYDQDWDISFLGTYHACFDQLDTFEAHDALIDGKTCESTQVEEMILEKDAIDRALALQMEALALQMEALGMGQPIRFTKEEIEAVQVLVNEEKAKLPRLKGQKITVNSSCISLYKLNEQGKDVKWAQIFAYNKDLTDCELKIIKRPFAKGSLKECLVTADVAILYA